MFMIGVGSFVMPKFNRDHAIWMALGSSRNPIMGLSILVGAGIIALSYKMQVTYERERLSRRRAAREEAALHAEEIDHKDESPESSSDSGTEWTAASSNTSAPLDRELATPEPVKMTPPEVRRGASEPQPVHSVTAVAVATSAAPQVVGESSRIALEKAGSESVVIEKRDEDTAKRPMEKSASSIMHPVAEKRVRPAPAFEEDPESIFDELPQTPPQSFK